MLFIRISKFSILVYTTFASFLSIFSCSREGEPPIANALAEPLIGTAPLQVQFDGSTSSDDQGIVEYLWDFTNDETSNAINPEYIFDEPGTYPVTLLVRDAEGLESKANLTITVSEPDEMGAPPIAKAVAEPLSGTAPLRVQFDGSGSRDDEGIVEYIWDISGEALTAISPEFTFETPGTYPVSLTVRDTEGRESRTNLTIAVSDKLGEGQITCDEGGGKASDTGRKIWCWSDISIPSYNDRKGIAISNGELHVDSECYEKQVSVVGDQLQFHIDPTGPEVGNWCENDFNMRAEVRTSPWDVRHAPGTEEWFGWSFHFADEYVIDTASQWLFFQAHNGIRGENALIAIWVVHEGQFSGHDAGELFVVNSSTPGSPIYSPTGYKPTAGTELDVVVQVIWGDENTGLFKVWFNGNQVYSASGRTITPSHNYGGNAKWGIYKWPWRKSDGVNRSKSVGVTSLKASMGPLRMITRRPDDPDYRKYSYDAVSPD